MQIRDRIIELRRVPAGLLRPNPLNWRTHSAAQQNALRGVLAEVGYAGALLARQLPDGSLELIDGHLRAATTPDMLVPVLVLDVDEKEAAKLLSTFDPLTAMAGVDRALVEALHAQVETDNAAVLALLASVAPAAVDSLPGDAAEQAESSDATEPQPPAIRDVFQVVAQCADEDEQRELYQRLRGEGYVCKLLML